MSRVFISYARSDDKFAGRLAEDLRANGFDIWRDVDNIPVGVEWDGVINTALKQSNTMLLIISPAALMDEHVEHQWKHFLSRDKKIIPLFLCAAELPSALKYLPSIDFQNALSKDAITTDESYQRALCKLQTAMYQPIETNFAQNTQHGVLGGWTTILAVLAIGGILLGAFFAPVPNSYEQAQNASMATMIPNTQPPNTSN